MTDTRPSEGPLSDPPPRDGIARALDIDYEEFGGGRCTVAVTVSEKHTNKGGVAHGALSTTLLDKALGGALVSTLRKEEWCATAQLSVSFIDAGRTGERLIATGRLVRRGRGVAHLAGEVTGEGGRTISTATGTWAIFAEKPTYFTNPDSAA